MITVAISESEKVIRTLYQITTENHKGFDSQVERLLQLGCERFSLDIGILSRVDKENNEYYVVNSVSPEQLPVNKGEVFEFDKTYCAMTIAAEGPVGFEHMSTSSMKYHPAYQYFPLEAYIGAPVIVNGKVYGTLSFSSLTPVNQKFSDIDVDALQLMTAWIGAELLHIENNERLNKANEALRALANTDPLTGLNNRRAFQGFFTRFLRHARRVDMPVSIVMLDVDHFKHFNDNYGHLVGDTVLKQVASLLEENSRESDFVARYGGEEFIILLPNTDKSGAETYGENIRKKFHQTNWPRQDVTVSIGLSTSDFNDIDNLTPAQISEYVIDKADKALYYSKQNGRDRVSHFSNIDS